MNASAVKIERADVAAYRIPTDMPESDGTLAWDSMTLLGMVRPAIPVYGSGGFTNYTIEQLQRQLGGWAEAGMRMVKMKVGREPENDLARGAIGDETGLFVDANGACTRKQALAMARIFTECGVAWFEEPVSSDDLYGLRLMRDRAPPGMAISAGEYGYDLPYFRRMLEAQAVDVLQADNAQARTLMERLRQAEKPASMKLFDDPAQQHKIWNVRESGLGATAHLPNKEITWEGWEDSAVPPERLGDYLRKLRALFDKYGYDGDLYGHFGQGCVHTRINFDLETADGIDALRGAGAAAGGEGCRAGHADRRGRFQLPRTDRAGERARTGASVAGLAARWKRTGKACRRFE